MEPYQETKEGWLLYVWLCLYESREQREELHLILLSLHLLNLIIFVSLSLSRNRSSQLYFYSSCCSKYSGSLHQYLPDIIHSGIPFIRKFLPPFFLLYSLSLSLSHTHTLKVLFMSCSFFSLSLFSHTHTSFLSFFSVLSLRAHEHYSNTSPLSLTHNPLHAFSQFSMTCSPRHESLCHCQSSLFLSLSLSLVLEPRIN